MFRALKMNATKWTADQIRAEMKRTNKPFVLQQYSRFVDLTRHRAALLDGDFTVTESSHEVIVTDNGQRAKA